MPRGDQREAEIQRLWDAIRHERELREQHVAATEKALQLIAADRKELMQRRMAFYAMVITIVVTVVSVLLRFLPMP